MGGTIRLVVMVAAITVTGVTSAQIEIDRTLQRIYGTPIMASDVQQARMLALFPGVTSDEDLLRALENRLLVLREAARAPIDEPPADAIAARRAAWAAALPAGTDVPTLLREAGMTDRALDGWFRDTLRMEAYIDQRFGRADAKRDERVAAWIRDLRHRANLPAGQ